MIKKTLWNKPLNVEIVMGLSKDLVIFLHANGCTTADSAGVPNS